MCTMDDLVPTDFNNLIFILECVIISWRSFLIQANLKVHIYPTIAPILIFAASWKISLLYCNLLI